MTTHTYRSTLDWSGTTATTAYDRSHDVVVGDGKQVRLSADAAFHGDASLLNPEELLVAAASSCQLLTFLAVAAGSGVTVVGYDDEASAEMPGDRRPTGLTSITLRPRIRVGRTGSERIEDRVERLVHKAHEQCYVARSLATPITVEPVVEVVTG